MSVNQLQLFELMSNYAVETILGCINLIYHRFGMKVVAGDALIPLITPFIQQYFNYIAHNIYSKNDCYITRKFDEMQNIKLPSENHPIDILNNIVMLSLYLLQNLDISAVIGLSHCRTMTAVKCHLHTLCKRKINIAASLNGCDNTHIHNPINIDDKIYTFTLDNIKSKTI